MNPDVIIMSFCLSLPILPLKKLLSSPVPLSLQFYKGDLINSGRLIRRTKAFVAYLLFHFGKDWASENPRWNVRSLIFNHSYVGPKAGRWNHHICKHLCHTHIQARISQLLILILYLLVSLMGPTWWAITRMPVLAHLWHTPIFSGHSGEQQFSNLKH